MIFAGSFNAVCPLWEEDRQVMKQRTGTLVFYLFSTSFILIHLGPFYVMVPFIFSAVFFSPQLILWKYHYRLIQRCLLMPQVILLLIKLKVLSHHSKYIFHIMLHLSYFTFVAELQLFMGETVLLANIFL